MNSYRSFRIWESTRKGWEADRYGVTMCSQTKEGLCRMIDQYLEDRAAWITSRQA